jgi:NADPH:quinone reductase-like Zn-dependent oxidoreductase
MKAFILDRYEKKGSLRLGEMPEPELRDNDVLVEVHAAGVNVLDSKIRNGEFKLILPYRLPLILGNDVAGVVVRVGRKVRRFEPGDEVYARPAQEPGGQLISISGPPDVAFAKENGSNWLLQQVMRLSRASASAEKPGELASATRSFL